MAGQPWHQGGTAPGEAGAGLLKNAKVQGTLNFGPLRWCPLGAIGLDLVKGTSITA